MIQECRPEPGWRGGQAHVENRLVRPPKRDGFLMKQAGNTPETLVHQDLSRFASVEPFRNVSAPCGSFPMMLRAMQSPIHSVGLGR